MANQTDEKPQYTFTAVTEEDGRGVFLAFAGMSATDFLNEARASVKRQDDQIDDQKAEINRQRVELQSKDEVIGARNREIAALHKTVAEKNTKVEELTAATATKDTELAAKEAALKEATRKLQQVSEKLALVQTAAKASIPKMLERLEGGGIRLPVTLDVDESAPLLSWAQDSGAKNDEEIAAYIATQVHDALVAVTSS
jgi:septal ring factor EnvC (AmiA/AmiB activator)